MAEHKTRKQLEREKRLQAVISDGCNSELVRNAEFDGMFQIPIIKRPEKIVIPRAMVPFSKAEKVEPERFAVCEYENDRDFADLLINPTEYVKEFKKYQAFITPDCSLYWDMPFAAQVVNKYRNHVIGHYMQSKGVYVIPNVRWGDERTYTTKYFPEKLAFLGVEKHAIVSIGSYGMVKQKEEKKIYREGLEAMLETLEPETVLVYGAMPDEIFKQHMYDVQFVQYEDWTSLVRKDED